MLSVEGVSLQYEAALALRDVSITAEPGVVPAMLGRNGVGKTSLLRAGDAPPAADPGRADGGHPAIDH